MKTNITVKLISSDDIRESGCIDHNNIMSVIEQCLIDYKNNEFILPEKISQIFDDETQNRINCMPATLKKHNICGVKWVSVFPGNPMGFGCRNVSGVVILSELKKGYPFSIVDGTLITALRTACIGAVASKYLANRNSKVYCAIGTGEQGRMHFKAIKSVYSQIDTCYVASHTNAEEQAFIEDLSADYPDVSFIECGGDYRKASKDADIIVTAVSCQEPLLKADSIKKGAFYCHVGGLEDEYEVPLMADKIVCDQWKAVKHRTQTISRLYKQGKLKDEDIYADIADIISGEKPGRENESEFIYFNSVGLAFIDVSVAYEFYKKAVEAGRFTEWTMLDN